MSASLIAKYSIPEFNGENFRIWSKMIEDRLDEEGLLFIVENGYEKPDPVTVLTDEQKEEYKQSKMHDLRALALIFEYLSHDLAMKFYHSQTAKEVWDALKKKYNPNGNWKETIMAQRDAKLVEHVAKTSTSIQTNMQAQDLEIPVGSRRKGLDKFAEGQMNDAERGSEDPMPVEPRRTSEIKMKKPAAKELEAATAASSKRKDKSDRNQMKRPASAGGGPSQVEHTHKHKLKNSQINEPENISGKSTSVELKDKKTLCEHCDCEVDSANTPENERPIEPERGIENLEKVDQINVKEAAITVEEGASAHMRNPGSSNSRVVAAFSKQKQAFEIILSKTALKPTCQLHFPTRASEMLPSTKIKASVLHNDKTYKVVFYGTKKQKYFGSGWRVFVEDLELKVRDLLKFEILKSTSSELHLRVVIVRSKDNAQSAAKKRRVEHGVANAIHKDNIEEEIEEDDGGEESDEDTDESSDDDHDDDDDDDYEEDGSN